MLFIIISRQSDVQPAFDPFGFDIIGNQTQPLGKSMAIDMEQHTRNRHQHSCAFRLPRHKVGIILQTLAPLSSTP